jgi:hypothetical protein
MEKGKRQGLIKKILASGVALSVLVGGGLIASEMNEPAPIVERVFNLPEEVKLQLDELYKEHGTTNRLEDSALAIVTYLRANDVYMSSCTNFMADNLTDEECAIKLVEAPHTFKYSDDALDMFVEGFDYMTVQGQEGVFTLGIDPHPEEGEEPEMN